MEITRTGRQPQSRMGISRRSLRTLARSMQGDAVMNSRKEHRTIPADQVLAKLPVARRAKIKERAAELIAEELGPKNRKP